MMTPLEFEARSKVKIDTCKTFTDHYFLQVVFTLGSPRTKNMGNTTPFKYVTQIDLEAVDKCQIQQLLKFEG